MPENANEKYYAVFMAHAWVRGLSHREKRAIDAVVQVARDEGMAAGRIAEALNIADWDWSELDALRSGHALGITQDDLDQAREAAVNDHYGLNFMMALERYAMEAGDAKTTEP